jgi:hypothetical protein
MDPGSASNAEVLNAYALAASMATNCIRFCNPEPLPADGVPMPYFLVGEASFALRTWLMQPFSHRNMLIEHTILNYRLSRARHIVQNAFAILTHTLRGLLIRMQRQPHSSCSAATPPLWLDNLMRMPFEALQNVDNDQEDVHYTIVPGVGSTAEEMEYVNAIQGEKPDSVA